MQICGLEKMSLVDFDGCVAATLFTGGCNFRCPFCHNAALVLDADALPTIPEEEILAYLKKRKGILDGVCISGGEPTLQKDLPAFCEKVKSIGYRIKLDTNGTNPKVVKSLFENGLVDYFAMDIKNDKASYAKIVGFSSYDTKNVEESVDFFLSGRADYEFRTTLIAQFHQENNIRAIAEWIKGANRYFLQKFKDSETCLESHLSAVDEKVVLGYVSLLRSSVPNTFLRGYDVTL